MAVKHHHDMLDNNNSAAAGNKSNETNIIGLLRLIRTNPDNLSLFCQKIVEILCQEPLPKDKDAIKQFNETMVTYKEHLAEICSQKNENSQLIINECLKNLYKEMVTRPQMISGAASIILTMFNMKLIPKAVRWILANEDNASSNEAIQRVFEVLVQWVCTTTCTPNINSWIIEILVGLFDDQRYDLLLEISLGVIEKLMKYVKIPVIRPQVLTVIQYVLISERRTPKLFFLAVPRLSEVIKSLNGELGDREIQFLNTIKDLMTHFPVYDDQYQEIEHLLGVLGQQRFKEDHSDHILTSSSSVALSAVASNNPRVGLVNLGNTCYMNSVLQALVMTKQFSREILLTNMNQSTRSELVFHIQKLLAQLLHSRRPELTPREVLHAARPPGFLPGHQQDSSEFLGHLLDMLHEQETHLRRKQMRLGGNHQVVMMDVSGDDTQEESEEMMDYEGEEAKNQQTLIQRTFGGAISITYECLNCGETSTNKDSFRDIPLAFPDKPGESISEGNFYVQQLLDYYCSSEKLEGDNKYFCDKCEKLCDGLRSINFVAPPKNLILTLKHFKYDQQCHTRAKLMHSVYHDESVTLKVVNCSSSNSNNTEPSSSSNSSSSQSNSNNPNNNVIKQVKYNLYAAVVHSGMSMDAGHYYTYASDQPNSWYKFNDNYVTRCSVDDLHSLKPPNTPYILFYKMDTAAKAVASTSSGGAPQLSLPELEELPLHLREFVVKDNVSYCQEMKNESNRAVMFKTKEFRDPDDRDPPSSCGGNAINHCNSYIC